MKVMVTGSRDWEDARTIDAVLNGLFPTLVIHGAARGADSIADAWARRHGVPVLAIPADWARHGKAAGAIRNGALLDEQPDLVLAFLLPQSRGTIEAVAEAQRRRIPTIVLAKG